MGINELDFDELKMGVACIEAKEKQEMLTLKLNSIFNGAEVLMESIKILIESRKDFNNPPDNFINFNIDAYTTRLSKLSSSEKDGKIPSCLNDIISGKYNMNFNRQDDFLHHSHSSYTSSGALSGLLNRFNNGSNHAIKVVNNTVNHVMELVLGQEDMAVFLKLELLESYLKNTNFLGVYRNWKDMTNCIEKNCPLLINSLEDDAFLYSDIKKKKFILPIDTNNGTIRIKKFFDSKTINPFEKKKLEKLEQRYTNYKADKLRKLKMGEHKLKMAGVVNNPFSHIINNSKRNDTINNLF